MSPSVFHSSQYCIYIQFTSFIELNNILNHNKTFYIFVLLNTEKKKKLFKNIIFLSDLSEKWCNFWLFLFHSDKQKQKHKSKSISFLCILLEKFPSQNHKSTSKIKYLSLKCWNFHMIEKKATYDFRVI